MLKDIAKCIIYPKAISSLGWDWRISGCFLEIVSLRQETNKELIDFKNVEQVFNQSMDVIQKYLVIYSNDSNYIEKFGKSNLDINEKSILFIVNELKTGFIEILRKHYAFVPGLDVDKFRFSLHDWIHKIKVHFKFDWLKGNYKINSDNN